MQGPGLGQLLGEVVLEHEGLDGQCGWPLLLAVAKDWSALSTTPCSDRDEKGNQTNRHRSQMGRSRGREERRCPLGKGHDGPGLAGSNRVGLQCDTAPRIFCQTLP